MKTRPKILFIIDDSKEQSSIEQALADRFQLDFCYDAHDAVEHVATTRPEIVVLSFQDDGVSPLALTHIFRREEGQPYIGLIYIAQTESSEWLHRLLSAGVDICLPQDRTLLQTGAAIDAVLRLCVAKGEILNLNQKLHSAYKKLKDQAFTDRVTGFGNQEFLRNQLRVEFKRAQRYQKHLVLLLLRVEDFVIGEAPSIMEESLLLRISEVINSTVRFEIDFAGRSDATEFFVILPETDIDGAIAVAERMRAQVAKLHRSTAGRHLASSVGVVHFNGDRGNFESAEELLNTAHSAVEAALAHGGDQYWALDTPSEVALGEQSA